QRSLGMLTHGRTTIAIAHRLSTLRDSDYLAVIDNGTIAEYGTYRELMTNKGEFYRLYKIQSEALKTIGIGGEEEKGAEENAEEEHHE
ncbi:MAG: ABC transporter, partial [Clostridia bacterium]|nr:ABC transporter [Clostridia bacterium]